MNCTTPIYPSSSQVICAQPTHITSATPPNDIVFVANTRYLAVCTSSLLFSVKEEIDRAHREDGSGRNTLFLDEALKCLREAHEQFQRNIDQHTYSFIPDAVINPTPSAQPMLVTLRRQIAARELDRKIQECIAVKQTQPSTYVLPCDTLQLPYVPAAATVAPITTCTPQPYTHMHQQAVPVSCCSDRPYTVPPPPPLQQQFQFSLACTTPMNCSSETNENDTNDDTTTEETDDSASSWQRDTSDDEDANDSPYHPTYVEPRPPTCIETRLPPYCISSTTNKRSTMNQRPHETTKRSTRSIRRQSPPRPVHGRSTTRYQLRPLRHIPRYTTSRHG